MKQAQLLFFCLWWIVAILVTGKVEGNIIGWRFFLLWHTARCTVGYGCYILRELMDHSGLPSYTILSFTRTLPGSRIFQKFLQPHDDNYHLLHHLLPNVPMTQMHGMHLWLMDHVDEYASANSKGSFLKSILSYLTIYIQDTNLISTVKTHYFGPRSILLRLQRVFDQHGVEKQAIRLHTVGSTNIYDSL